MHQTARALLRSTARLDALRGRGLLFALALFCLTLPGAASAACLPVANGPSLLVPAALTADDAVAADRVRLTFLGHASFLIESPEGRSAVTDYNGYIRPPSPPDIVTMNNAHGTHYTSMVDPEIPNVLRGWDPAGGMAVHDLTVGDMRVRNIPTNVRDVGGTRLNGNSIFVFEVGGLCIAHLGHLHHTLTDTHLAELGLIDILLVPVDGSFTMAQDLMAEVIGQIQPAVIIPMHYFSTSNLDRFLERMRGRYEVRIHETPTITISRTTLPYRQVLILPGS